MSGTRRDMRKHENTAVPLSPVKPGANQLLLLTGESRRFALRSPAGEHVVGINYNMISRNTAENWAIAFWGWVLACCILTLGASFGGVAMVRFVGYGLFGRLLCSLVLGASFAPMITGELVVSPFRPEYPVGEGFASQEALTAWQRSNALTDTHGHVIAAILTILLVWPLIATCVWMRRAWRGRVGKAAWACTGVYVVVAVSAFAWLFCGWDAVMD